MASRLRVLTSYYYWKKTDIEHWVRVHCHDIIPDIFADSGAYSAFTQNETINIDDYIDWLHQWSYLITTYANLDVLGDPEQTKINQSILESAGLNPLPVFHVGDEFKYLYEMVERYPYIAIGGMVGHSFKKGNQLARWLVRVFKIAEGKSVLHGFGITSWQIMSTFKWFSLDSTTWLSGAKFARLALFNQGRGSMKQFRLFDKLDVLDNARLIRSYGFKPVNFFVRDKSTRQLTVCLGGLSMVKAETYRQESDPVIMPETTLFNPATPNDSGSLIYPHDDRLGLRIYLGDVPSGRALGWLHDEIQSRQ